MCECMYLSSVRAAVRQFRSYKPTAVVWMHTWGYVWASSERVSSWMHHASIGQRTTKYSLRAKGRLFSSSPANAAGLMLRPCFRPQVPERIDYVWSTFAPVSASVELQRVPCADEDASPLSYSDHFAVQVELELSNKATARCAWMWGCEVWPHTHTCWTCLGAIFAQVKPGFSVKTSGYVCKSLLHLAHGMPRRIPFQLKAPPKSQYFYVCAHACTHNQASVAMSNAFEHSCHSLQYLASSCDSPVHFHLLLWVMLTSMFALQCTALQYRHDPLDVAYSVVAHLQVKNVSV